MFLVFYYLILPFLLAWVVIKYLKKHAPSTIPEDVLRLYAAKPVERKWFRAARRDHKGLHPLGDFEKQPEAVEAAYQGLKDARAAGETGASFIVLNDKGDTLEQIDA